jgi:RNA polymerase sigma-70 factor, ECF subfamily
MPDEKEVRALLERRRWDEAFDCLLRMYQGKVFRLAYSILGNRAQAEDAAQDAFLRVWRSMESYRGQASLATWLFAITRNTALSLREYHARRRTLGLEAISEPAAPVGRGDDSEQELWHIVAELPEQYRQVILLFHMEGKSYEEVSRMLEIPLGTVRTHLYRARKMLGDMMEGRSHEA